MALTTLGIKHAKPGLHADGGGLYLQVTKADTRSWIFRYQLDGRRREMGLGSVLDVSLTKARAMAEELKSGTKKGRDPLEERRAAAELASLSAAEANKQATLSSKTFGEVSRLYISDHEPGWTNVKHAQQWPNTLKTYAFPVIENIPINKITTQDILEILRPIWSSKPETARRVRSRLELVIDYGKARGWHEGNNPAVWRGHLSALLPATSKGKRPSHHPALPWKFMGEFMADLRAMSGVGAKALEFTILTAARSGETRGAVWSEIDFDEKTWTVPAARMKGGKEHCVPLSEPAIKLLEDMARVEGEDLIFPGTKSRRPLSDMSLSAVLRRMKRLAITVHGFRSSFRDWAAEATDHHPDIVEQALAHAIGNRVEAAYRRGNLLEKRRVLMEDWAEWCCA